MRRESIAVWWIIALILCVIGGLLWVWGQRAPSGLLAVVAGGVLCGLGVFFFLAAWYCIARTLRLQEREWNKLNEDR